MSSEHNRHLRALQRRADYLAERVASARIQGNTLSYDISELHAIQWALDQLSRPEGQTPFAGRP